MLPIALTCPVWWVARWTARMLASLAVVVACSLGATTLPVGAAAQAAPRSLDVPARDGGVSAVPAPAVTGAVGADPAGAGTRATVPVAGPEPVAPREAAAVPVDRHRVLAGLVPATVGSRAPPAR